MGMLPGVGKIKKQLDAANLDKRVLRRQLAIIDSMTLQERRNPEVLKACRKKRVAAGSGTKVEDINRLLKMHRSMARHDEGYGLGQARADGGARQHAGPRRRHAEPEEMQKLAEKMPGGCRDCQRACRARGAGLPPPCPACRRNFPAGRCSPASAASRRG